MANKKLKGITIEISGNTTKLNDALKDTNKAIYNANSELKELKHALKLDPKNTELLAQKQELLKKNIMESTSRLNQLKEAQKQMGNYNFLTEEQKENYRALTIEIAKSESAIKNMNDELKKTNAIDLSKIGTTLKKVGSIATEVVKKVGQVVTGISTALAGVITAGVKSYADLEQSIGGVETLFGDSAQKVINNAKKAYETAGVSANEYMQGVTSFSASLLQSLGGDTIKAADVADMAFRDMSDNANKFGTDMSSIQNAYQGFAKQNYTMLDNLKLGFGGTKSEMERLLVEAEKFSGIHYDINNLSDVYNAIHVIQTELKITGTTAEEAEKTISGSAKAMKAVFNNFLNGSGSPKELSKSITIFLKNVTQTISELAPDILTGITTLLSEIIPEIGTLLINLLPQLFQSVQEMITNLFAMIQQNTQPIANMVVNVLMNLVNFILQNLPMIIDAGLKIIVALAQGITNSIPTLIPAIIESLLSIIDTLLNNIDMIVDTGIQLIMGLSQGLLDAIPKLIDKVPEIIDKLIMALTDNLPKIIAMGVEMQVKLIAGIIKAIPKFWEATPKVIGSLVKGLLNLVYKLVEAGGTLLSKLIQGITDGLSKIKDVGKNLVHGLWNGIKDTTGWIIDKIKGFGNSIVKNIKNVFGIHSPSRLMRDQVGINLSKGIGEGFKLGMPETLKEVKRAMRDLNFGIQESVNPVINPTTNSNPLILNIDKFVNQRETDIQELAEDLEFYRKNSALAKGDS